MNKKPHPTQCTGKVKFDSFEHAEQIAHRKSRRNDLKPRVYHCIYCGGFHIGNSNRLQAKQRRRYHALQEEAR